MLAELVMPGKTRSTSKTRPAKSGVTWTLEMKAPAETEIYDFPITVHVSARPEHRFARKELTDEDRADVERRLREVIRPKARTVPPERPGQAEERINQALAAEAIAVGRLRVSAFAEVQVADELRTMKQDQDRRLHDVRTKAETSKLAAHTYTESRKVWEEFLGAAQQSWSAKYATQLAEKPGNVAGVLQKMLEDRKDAATDFVGGLDKIAKDLEHSNIYDLVTESDHALRHAMEALGLSVPPRSSDPLVSG